MQAVGRIVSIGDQAVHIGGRLTPKSALAINLSHPRFGLNLGILAKLTGRSAVDYATLAAAQSVLQDILGNDKFGNCTEADQYHQQAMRQAAAGIPVFHPTLSQVLATYSRDSGFVMGQPSTDVGCDENTVLQNAQSYGISNGPGATDVDKILGYAAVDSSNVQLWQFCIDAFVGGSFCAQLAQQCVSPMPSGPGWTWDVPQGGYVPVPQDGHCMTISGYDSVAKMVKAQSWAMPFEATYAFLEAAAAEENGGSLFFRLDQEIINKITQQAPDLLDWTAVVNAFNALPSGVMQPVGP
jgi:hypothetical protein